MSQYVTICHNMSQYWYILLEFCVNCMFFHQKFPILSNFCVLTFWAIGKIPHLEISCHSQNLSFFINQLCGIQKSVSWGFWVLFLAPSEPHTLVPIKMLVSILTTLHASRQTSGFSTIGKEQPWFKSVTRLNPVFQPILTVIFHYVLLDWTLTFW